VFSILLQQLVSTVDCIVVPASTTEPNNALLTRMVYICQHVIMMEWKFDKACVYFGDRVDTWCYSK
jgi:hypothetical protein